MVRTNGRGFREAAELRRVHGRGGESAGFREARSGRRKRGGGGGEEEGGGGRRRR